VLWVSSCQKYTSCTHQINELNNEYQKEQNMVLLIPTGPVWILNVDFCKVVCCIGWVWSLLCRATCTLHPELLLGFWQSYILKQLGCFCTETRCKYAQMYPIVPHVQPPSRLKCIVQFNVVDPMKIKHQTAYEGVNIAHRSSFHWKRVNIYLGSWSNSCRSAGICTSYALSPPNIKYSHWTVYMRWLHQRSVTGWLCAA